MGDTDCPLCNQQFSTEEELTSHKNQSHSEFTEMYGQEDRGTDSILNKVANLAGGETDEQDAEKPDDDLILPPKDKSKPWYGRVDLPAEENDEVETGWQDPDTGELTQKRPKKMSYIDPDNEYGKGYREDLYGKLDEVSKVAKYIRGKERYAKETTDAEVLDFFSPPEEDDFAKCDICGEKYPGGDTEGMRQHLLNKHINTIKESRAKAREIGSMETPLTPQVDTPQTPQIGTPQLPEQPTGATEETDEYEVDVDEYTKTGEPVQDIPKDKRADEEVDDYSETCPECGKVFDNPADAGSHAVRHDNERYSEEGGAGSGPTGGTPALLPEQAARANTDYDAFKPTPRGDRLQTDPALSRMTEEAPEDEKLKRLEEVWYKVSTETRTKIFESLGITQGDAYILAGLEYQYITEAVKKDIVKEAEYDFNEEEDKLEKYSRVNEEDDEEEEELNEAYSFTYDLEKNHRSKDFKKKDLICTRCNESFYNSKDRNVHFNEVHMDANEYELPDQCPFCQEIIKEPETLDWHMQQEHGAHVASQYTQTGIQGAMADTDDFGIDQDFYNESRKRAKEDVTFGGDYQQRIDNAWNDWNNGPLLTDADAEKDPTNYMNTVNWWHYAESHGLTKEEADQKMKQETGESRAREAVPSDDQVVQDWWQLISEAGGDGDYMSKAMVNGPDNSPNWESGDPIMWDEFSSSQQQALTNAAGGIGGMIERLMSEGWSDYTDEEEDSYESISNIVNESRVTDLKKEIKKLTNFINIASIENPMNMGDKEEELKRLKDELSSLGEAYAREFMVVCPKCSQTYNHLQTGGICEYCGADNRKFYGESRRKAKEIGNWQDDMGQWQDDNINAEIEDAMKYMSNPTDYEQIYERLRFGLGMDDASAMDAMRQNPNSAKVLSLSGINEAKEDFSQFDHEDLFPTDPEGDEWREEGTLMKSNYDMSQQDMNRLYIDTMKEALTRAIQEGGANMNWSYWDDLLNWWTPHTAMFDLPGTKGETPEAQQAFQQAKQEVKNWFRDQKQSISATYPTPTWESKANEASIYGSFVDKYFEEEYVMDQDGMYLCKLCKARMDVGNPDIMHGFSPDEVARQHMKTDHGVTESKATEIDPMTSSLRSWWKTLSLSELEREKSTIEGQMAETERNDPNNVEKISNSYESLRYLDLEIEKRRGGESKANEDDVDSDIHKKAMAKHRLGDDYEEGDKAEEDDGTTIANSGHRSTYSDYSLGKEDEPKDKKNRLDYADKMDQYIEILREEGDNIEPQEFYESKAKEDFDFDAAEPARIKLLLDQYKSGEDWVSDPKRLESEDGSFEGWLSYSKKFNINNQDARKAWSGEAKDRPVVEGPPVKVESQQCFDWEGHEIDCDSGKIIGDGYSKSKAYNKFLNESLVRKLEGKENNADDLMDDLMDEDGNPPDKLGVDDALAYLAKMGIPDEEAKDAVKRFGGSID